MARRWGLPNKALQLTAGAVSLQRLLAGPPPGPGQDRRRRPVGGKVGHGRRQLSADPLGGVDRTQTATLRVAGTIPVDLDGEPPLLVAYGEVVEGVVYPDMYAKLPSESGATSSLRIRDTTWVLLSRDPLVEPFGVVLEATSFEQRDAWEATLQPGYSIELHW